MDVFKERSDVFNEHFLLRNVQLMVRVGNELLTKRRFCQLARATRQLVEVNLAINKLKFQNSA